MKKEENMAVRVTFTEKERWLYEIVCSHSCKSGFIKDVLKEHLENQKPAPQSANFNDFSGIL
jgi:hypothetical protein